MRSIACAFRFGENELMSSTSPISLDANVLKILRCPLTRSPLRLEDDFLVAEVGGLRYPLREGIPVLMIEEAQLPIGISSLLELKEKLGIA